MEAVPLDPELAGGVVQPVLGAVTAPLHSTPVGERDDQDRNAPDLRPLFSSQTNVPLLAAPTGAASLHPPAVALSPALLATLGCLVLLCGIVVGTAARHLLVSPAPLLLVAPQAPVAASLPPAPKAIVPPAATVPNPPPPAPPSPVTTRVRARPIARQAKGSPTKPKTGPAKPKTWIDPWAD